MWFFQNPEIIFTHFELRHFSSSNITEVNSELIPCPLLPQFLADPFEIYLGFYDGLKICMWIFQNPEIIFYYFFCILT